MRRAQTALLLPIPLLFASFPILAQKETIRTAALESHEGLTITAQTWTEPAQYKPNFPKKSPLSAGVLAIQVAFRNDTDQSMRVNLERIRLLLSMPEGNRMNLTPRSSEDVADLTLKPGSSDPTATRKKFPFPTGGPKQRRSKEWNELEQAARDAGVPSSVVAARSTVKGLLYFDIANQFDLLSEAHLYVPEVVVLEKGQALTFFEIDLGRSGASR